MKDADALFRRALEMNERMGHRPETVRTLEALAHVLDGDGRSREARERLFEGIERFRPEPMSKATQPHVPAARRR